MRQNRHTKLFRLCMMHRLLFVCIILSAIVSLNCHTSVAQVRYPVHGTVQVVPPYGLYLSDYYGGSQGRLVVTLLNRDLEQPLLQARLRVRVKNGANFSLESRDEIVYPILEMTPNVPLRLTSIDIAPYLQSDHIRQSGRLDNGRLPVGMTECGFLKKVDSINVTLLLILRYVDF